MKKPSIRVNFGEGGFQGFLARHVEKFVLGVAVLLVLLFVYFGWSIEPYEKTPDSLRSVAERAQQHIGRDTWENLREDRIPTTGLKEIVQTSRMATDPQPYWTPLPLKPPTKAQHTKRRDPELFAPTKLEVHALTAAVAMKPRRGLKDVLADAKNAEPPKESEQERRRREARERRERERAGRRQGGVGGDAPPGMMGSGGLFGAGGEAGGEDPAGMPGMGYGGSEPPPGMDGGLFGGGEMGGPMAGGTIRRYRGKVEGWQPGGGGFTGGSMGPPGMMPGMGGPEMGGAEMGPDAGGTGMSGGGGSSQVIPESHSFVAVKALVPYQKQFEEFERALEGPFYEAGRDMPRYIYIWVERAEVGDDPDAPLAWTQLETWRAERIAEQYGGVVREVADAKYVDVPKICHPVPPVLMHPLDKLLTHPELPKKSAPKAQPDAAGEAEQPEKEPGSDLPGSDLPSGQMAGPGRAGMGMPGMGPPGMDGGVGIPGMDGGMGMPGMDDGMAPPGYGGDEGGMAGMPGYSSGPGSRGSTFEVPQYKLVRFFDFQVKPGKTYKYRVKLFIEDPNNPNPKGRYAAPSKRMLAPEVVTRLDDPNRDKSQFWRTTEWSEPSEAVTVPEPGRLLAGPVETGKTGRLNDQEVKLEEDHGSFVPVVWDARRAVDVPAERSVYRGAFLNFTRSAEVVHPVSLVIKMLEDYQFQTDSLIVDLRGGEELPGPGEEPMTAPGEFALIDGDGKLIVRNELDDMEAFRRFTLAEEKEQRESTGAAPGMPGMPGMPGVGDEGGGGLFGPPGMGPPGMGLN